MKIDKILSEHRNDFSAVMVCEHCGSTQTLRSGYHDNFYHTKVIPDMACKSCGKRRDGAAGDNFNGTNSVATASDLQAAARARIGDKS